MLLHTETHTTCHCLHIWADKKKIVDVSSIKMYSYTVCSSFAPASYFLGTVLPAFGDIVAIGTGHGRQTDTYMADGRVTPRQTDIQVRHKSRIWPGASQP